MNDSRFPHDRMAKHLADVPRSGIRDFFEIVSSRADVISLGIGEPDFVTPWHIREGAVYALNRGATSYTSNLGMPRLREAISAYLRDRYGLVYDPHSEVLVTVGVSEGLDLAIRALVNPGDHVLYHEPCYVSYSPVIQFAHGVPVPVETHAGDLFRWSRPALEEAWSDRCRLLMVNYPNNPTGATLDEEAANGVAEFVKAHDMMLISDEIYSELTYDGCIESPLTRPGMKARTILLSGFSKAWAMTGFRLGYACGPAPVIEAMMKIHQYTMLCAPVLAQEAAIEALRHGAKDVAEMRDAYCLRRNYLHAVLTDAGLPCLCPKGAFYCFPDISGTGLSSREFALRLLEEENVACVPGTAFGACGEGFLRCSYATGMDELKCAGERISRFVGRLDAP